MTKEWQKFQTEAADDYIKWANIAEYVKHNGPSLKMSLLASRAAELLRDLATMNR